MPTIDEIFNSLDFTTFLNGIVPANITFPEEPADNAQYLGQKWTLAQAQAKWAANYMKVIEKNAQWNKVISILQFVASVYFAKKQYDIAQQAQDRLDEIKTEQLDLAETLRTQFEYVINCEKKAADDACILTEWTPDYYAVKARTIAPIAQHFSKLKEQNVVCSSVNCGPATCATDRYYSVMQAATTHAALEGAYRKEEALAETRRMRDREVRFKMLQHMRGHAIAAGGFLSGALATTQAAAGINPYAGYASAIGGGLQRVGAAFTGANTAEALAGMPQMQETSTIPTIPSGLSSFQAMPTLSPSENSLDGSYGDFGGSLMQQLPLINVDTKMLDPLNSPNVNVIGGNANANMPI